METLDKTKLKKELKEIIHDSNPKNKMFELIALLIIVFLANIAFYQMKTIETLKANALIEKEKTEDEQELLRECMATTYSLTGDSE